MSLRPIPRPTPGSGTDIVIGFGTPGLSAYEQAVLAGFQGTVDEWLASLRGEGGGATAEQIEAIEQAQQDAAAAVAAAANAGSTAAGAATAAAQAGQAAGQAQTAAQAAGTSAQGAQEAATKATEDAQAAQSVAHGAQTAAQQAATAAQGAQTAVGTVATSQAAMQAVIDALILRIVALEEGEPSINVAPTITTDPTLSPASLIGGSSFTVNVGAATGTPAPSVAWSLSVPGYPPVTGTANGGGTVPNVSAAATATLTVTWANSISPDAVRTITRAVAVAAAPAPTFTTQPTATPANAEVGQTVNLSLGIASNSTSLTGRLMQGGTDRTSQIADGVWSPSVAGAYTWVVTATGPGGTATSNTISGTISAPVTQPPVSYSLSSWRLDETNAISGTATAVTGITNRGAGTYNPTVTGTGAEVTKEANGFKFTDGKFFQASGIGMSGLGGVFAIVKVTNDSYGSGLASFLEANPTGATIVLRNSRGTLQAIYNDGTARTNTLGNVVYGQTFSIGIEIDNDAGRVRFLHPDGSISTVTPAAVPSINFVTVRLGQRVIGTIHEQAIFTKPVGGTFAQTFETVAADFRAA